MQGSTMDQLSFLAVVLFLISYGYTHASLDNLDCTKWPNNVTGCSVCPVDMINLEIICYNTSAFPVLSPEESLLVTRLIINRSELVLPNIADTYPNLERIVFSNDNFRNGLKRTTFGGLQHLSYLIFYWTPLTMDDFSQLLCSLDSGYFQADFEGIFQELVNLTEESIACLGGTNIHTLSLRSNWIWAPSVKTLLCSLGPEMKSVSIAQNLPGTIPIAITKDYFHCLENKTALESLGLTSTWVEGIRNENLRHLQHIKSLDLYHVYFFGINDLAVLDNLTSLDIGENAYRDFRRFSASNVTFDNLETLDLTKNSFSILYPFQGHIFPCLKILLLSKNHEIIQELPNNFISNLNNLQELYLDNSKVGMVSEKVFLSNSLKALHLDRLTVVLERVPLKIFTYASELKNLSLNYLNIQIPKTNEYGIIDHFASNAFQNLTQLENLNLFYVGIMAIHRDMFLGTNRLKYIDLSSNRISHIVSGSMSQLLSLILLNLNSNHLQMINSSMLPNTTHVMNIYLSYNPLTCDCHLYDLRQWLNNLSNYRFDRGTLYTCVLGAGGMEKKVTDYNPTYRECKTNQMPIIYEVISCATIVISIIVLLSSVIVRFRWHIYYCYIRARANSQKYKDLKDVKEYKYDAFISYNRNDISWVVRNLRPVLEEQHGFKLCLHDRDWLAGADIVDNIIGSIDNSRKVVLVITNAFSASNWCQLELTMAQHKLFSEDRNNLVLVMKEEVVDALMTPRLALEMRQRTYIKWEEGGMGERVFWRRLVEAIRGPVGSVKQTCP